MKLRVFVLSIVYILSLIAIIIILLSAFAFSWGLASEDSYPGEFLLWVVQTPVILTLIYFSTLMFFRVVQTEGGLYWQKWLKKAERGFDNLMAKID